MFGKRKGKIKVSDLLCVCNEYYDVRIVAGDYYPLCESVLAFHVLYEGCRDDIPRYFEKKKVRYWQITNAGGKYLEICIEGGY